MKNLKKRNKTIQYLIIAVVVIGIFLFIGKKAGWIGNKGITEVSVEKVLKRNIVETVSANGKVQPEVQVKISSDVSGEIVELYVKEGDQVKAGDLLAKIDPEIYIANMDRMKATLDNTKANASSSKARLAQVKAQFDNAKIVFDRSDKLFKQGAISQSEFDQAFTAYKTAKADVDASEQNVLAAEYSIKGTEAALSEANKNLLKTSIYAPVSGTISKLNVEKGERVVGTTQFTGTEMMIIANLNSMEVSVQVNENDIVRIAVNDSVDIEIDAYINRKFKGLVTEIATSANTTGAISTDQVTNFDVKIRILHESYADLMNGKPDTYSPFRPGMSASVDIRTKRSNNTLSIPIQAVALRSDTSGVYKERSKVVTGQGNDGGDNEVENKDQSSQDVEVKEYVFVLKDNKAVMVPVKIGIQDNTYIEILSGLKADDEVISGPYKVVNKELKNRQEVKVVPKEKLFEKKE